MAAVAAPPSDRGYSGFVSGQASCHNHDGGPVHHGLVVSGPAFVVADQPAVPQQPAEGALDDPSAADDLEAGLVAALDDLQGEAGGLFHPDGQRLAVIAAVGPHDLQGGQGVQQADGQELSPGAVADLGAGDHDRQQPALGVDGGVPASAVDFLPAVEPAAVLADGIGGLDDLGVGDEGRRLAPPGAGGAAERRRPPPATRRRSWPRRTPRPASPSDRAPSAVRPPALSRPSPSRPRAAALATAHRWCPTDTPAAGHGTGIRARCNCWRCGQGKGRQASRTPGTGWLRHLSRTRSPLTFPADTPDVTRSTRVTPATSAPADLYLQALSLPFNLGCPAL